MMDTNQILHHVHQIEKLQQEGSYEDVQSLLKDLEPVHVTMALLQETGMAKVLHQVLKICPVATVRKTAKLLLSKWKKLCGGGTPLSTGNVCHGKRPAKDLAQIREGNSCHGKRPAKDLAQIRERSGECQGGDDYASHGNVPQEEDEDEVRPRQRRVTEEGFGVSVESLKHQELTLHMTGEEGASPLDRDVDVPVPSTVTSPVGFTQRPAETSEITTAHTSSPVRSKCTQLLIQALGPEEAIGDEPAPDLRDLAEDIEKHIFMLHGKNELKYKLCVRSKVSNLRNPRSPHLRQGLLRGQLGPKAFARMSVMEMANKELKELRDEYTKSAIREHQRPLGVEGTCTDKVRCRRCGGFDCKVTQISRGALFLPGWVRNSSPDEDSMTFMSCADCGEEWYHSSWVCL